ncbi:hypothetical protein CVT24_001072, partial [Panaeolus cyanescens]
MTPSRSQSHQAIKYVALVQDLDVQDENAEKVDFGRKRPPTLPRLSSPIYPSSAPSTMTEWTPYAYTPGSSSRSQPATSSASNFISSARSTHRSSPHSPSTNS